MTGCPTGEVFVFRLRDGDGNIYTEYRYSAAKKPLNEFRKVVFDNVKVPGEGGILYLEVYYGDDVRDLAPMNVTLTVYDADRYTEKVNVSPKKARNSSSRPPRLTSTGMIIRQIKQTPICGKGHRNYESIRKNITSAYRNEGARG